MNTSSMLLRAANLFISTSFLTQATKNDKSLKIFQVPTVDPLTIETSLTFERKLTPS